MDYEQFKERLIKSQEAVVLLKEYFEKHGYDVEMPNLVIAPHAVGAFSKYADQGDLFITKDNERLIIEIKHSGVDFDLTNWPYQSMIVNSFTGYNSKKDKPNVHIILSKDRTHFASIRDKTFEHWQLKRTYDRYKKDNLLFYFIDTKFVKFFKL